MQKSVFGGADVDEGGLQQGVEIDDPTEVDVSRSGLVVPALDLILLKFSVMEQREPVLHILAVEKNLFCVFFFHQKFFRKSLFHNPRLRRRECQRHTARSVPECRRGHPPSPGRDKFKYFKGSAAAAGNDHALAVGRKKRPGGPG